VSRSTHTETSTVVIHVAKPLGKERKNGPHLSDLRKFVEDCEGLPDDLLVHITNGYMSEGGRYDVTLKTTWRHPAEEES
jgi:hypothetical protein